MAEPAYLWPRPLPSDWVERVTVAPLASLWPVTTPVLTRRAGSELG